MTIPTESNRHKTSTDRTIERLDVIRNWATDAEPDTDGPAAAALRSIGHLCDVVAALTDRVAVLGVCNRVADTLLHVASGNTIDAEGSAFIVSLVEQARAAISKATGGEACGSCGHRRDAHVAGGCSALHLVPTPGMACPCSGFVEAGS